MSSKSYNTNDGDTLADSTLNTPLNTPRSPLNENIPPPPGLSSGPPGGPPPRGPPGGPPGLSYGPGGRHPPGGRGPGGPPPRGPGGPPPGLSSDSAPSIENILNQVNKIPPKFISNNELKKELPKDDLTDLQDTIINAELNNQTKNTENNTNMIYISINIPFDIYNTDNSIFFKIGEFFNTFTDINLMDQQNVDTNATTKIINDIFHFQDESINNENSKIDYSFWFEDNELYTIDNANMQSFLNDLSKFIKSSKEMIKNTNIKYDIKSKESKKSKVLNVLYDKNEETTNNFNGGGINEIYYIKIKLPFEKIIDNDNELLKTLKTYITRLTGILNIDAKNNEDFVRNQIKLNINNIIEQNVFSKINSNELLNYIITNKVSKNENEYVYINLFNIIKKYYVLNQDKIHFIFEKNDDVIFILSNITIRPFLLMFYKTLIINNNDTIDAYFDRFNNKYNTRFNKSIL